MKEIYTLKLEDMLFYGYHGTDPNERQIGQRFLIDLEIFADLSKAGQTDDLHTSVNYVKVFRETKNIVENEKFNLLEALSRRIALKLLEEHDIIDRIKVRVRKPQVPIPEMTGTSCIEIEMTR